MLFRDFEQKIIKDINESGMSIDAVYFVMKSIMQEIEHKYIEICNTEDIAREEQKYEEEAVAAKNNEEDKLE